MNPLFARSALDDFGDYYDGIVQRVVPAYIGPAAGGNVPEPASLALFTLGALGLASAQRRKQQSA